MKIIRRCIKTGVINTREINISKESLSAWHVGKNLLDLAPHLTPEEVKFICFGEYSEKWMQEISEN